MEECTANYNGEHLFLFINQFDKVYPEGHIIEYRKDELIKLENDVNINKQATN